MAPALLKEIRKRVKKYENQIAALTIICCLSIMATA
jgi:hypothetical protein